MNHDELAAVVTSLREVMSGSRTSVDQDLVEFGWPEMYEQDERDAVWALFTEQGRSGATSRALGWVAAGPLLAALGNSAPKAPGVLLPGDPARPSASHDRGGVSVDGVIMPGDEDVVVFGATDVSGEPLVGLLPIDVASTRPFGADEHFAGRVCTLSANPHADIVRGPAAAAALDHSLAATRRALAHELNGVMMRMVELAVMHALVREQFGRAVATYQAVQHHLASARVHLQSSWDAAEWAWEPAVPASAMCAKAIAGRSLREVSRLCQQVLAGMGFSGEHPFSQLFRRGLVLDSIGSSSVELTLQMGRDALANGVLPAMPTLDRVGVDAMSRFDLMSVRSQAAQRVGG